MTALKLIPHRFRDTDAELGTIAVPVRHGQPDGARIELRFVRLGDRRGGGRPAVVFLTGGPGLSGVRAASGRLFPMFDALREQCDVILLDQRACVVHDLVPRAEPPAFPRDRAVTRAEYLDGISATVRDTVHALEARGIPSTALSTNESADDVAMLVRALYGHNARVALLGWSYGSHLAMAIIKRHPALVASAVLAAPEGPDHTLKLPSRVQRHFARLSQRAGTDLVRMMSRALEQLERQPAPAAGATLGRFDLQWIFSELAADTRALRKLPGWLERMERGDFSAVESDPLLRGAWTALREELPYAAVRYGFDCASGASAERRAHIATEGRDTLLGNTIDFPLPEICAAVGCPDLGDDFRAAPHGGMPVLFITGTLDCRTPAENVAELGAGLNDHQHLQVEDAGHGDLLLSSRVQAAIRRFCEESRVAETSVPVDRPFVFD